jgi:gamma-glutamyl-gamma-aminobutyrate hydrolase PuuD
MKITFDLYGDMNDVVIQAIVDELANDCQIYAKVKGSDRLLITMSDISHEQAFRLGSIVENVVNYHYNEMIKSLHSQEITELQQQVYEKAFAVPFTVEELQEIVY